MDSAVEERVQQQAIYQAPAYLFAREQGILSGRPRGAELLEELMQHLLSGPADSATPLDFSRVSFFRCLLRRRDAQQAALALGLAAR